MRAQLLVVPGCAHAEAAAATMVGALSRAGLAPAIETVVVDTTAQAKELGFIGSPSFFLDGQDLFPDPDAQAAVACRLYRTSAGTLTGLPNEATVLAALRTRLDDRSTRP